MEGFAFRFLVMVGWVLLVGGFWFSLYSVSGVMVLILFVFGDLSVRLGHMFVVEYFRFL